MTTREEEKKAKARVSNLKRAVGMVISVYDTTDGDPGAPLADLYKAAVVVSKQLNGNNTQERIRKLKAELARLEDK